MKKENRRISEETKKEIFERDGYKCQVCGKKLSLNEAVLDHKFPISRGGTSDPMNLQTLCKRCNVFKADRVVYFITTPISKQFATLFAHFFVRAPWKTMFIATASVVILFVSILIIEKEREEERLAKLLVNQNYETQIQNLNETENHIRQLLKFVDSQRNQLSITEETINNLRAEREALEPLVESDRAVVDALFANQEKRNRAAMNRERWIGVGYGILASIAASTILYIIRFCFVRFVGSDMAEPDSAIN